MRIRIVVSSWLLAILVVCACISITLWIYAPAAQRVEWIAGSIVHGLLALLIARWAYWLGRLDGEVSGRGREPIRHHVAGVTFEAAEDEKS